MMKMMIIILCFRMSLVSLLVRLKQTLQGPSSLGVAREERRHHRWARLHCEAIGFGLGFRVAQTTIQ